jgi:trimeric autotransporter adhesin
MRKILSIALLMLMALWATAQDVTNFDYTGSMQSFVVPATGNYQLEVWGAQGGGTTGVEGGKGGYTKGEVHLTAGQTVYIYVGGSGTSRTGGGFNGGAEGGVGRNSNDGLKGGGATDLRIGGTALSNRVIVAGGGGGAGGNGQGGGSSIRTGTGGIPGSGGGTAGINGSKGTANEATDGNGGTGGSQLAGGNGGTANMSSTTSTDRFYYPAGGGGGGGGYYGGGGGAGGSIIGGSTNWFGSTGNSGVSLNGGNGGNGANSGNAFYSGAGGGGAGGSGYTGTLLNAQILAGNTTMTNPAGGTMTGKSGNGYVRITKLCDPISVDVTPSTTVMFGTEVTITGTSANGGTITWDNGITNGVAFTANATTTYTATSTSTDDCPVSQTITVQKAVQVSTQAATGITTTGATANGTIVDTGDPTPTQHGFCWNTTGTPTTADSKTELGAIATNSTFTADLTGLTIGQTYYLRAFATNVTGTYYGDEITFTTLKLDQTITFNALSDKTYGDAAFDLTASASSTLAVGFTSSDETVATISGSTVTIVGAGTTTITASQAGNATYYAAPVVERTLTVNKKELTVINAVVTAKVYNGNTDAAITGATLTGVVGVDDVTLADADAGTFDNANVGTDKPVTTAMTITGTGTGNYTLAQPVITGHITAKELTVADAVVTTKVYDGNTDAAITGATLAGVVGADDVILSDADAGSFDNANMGADKPVTTAMTITGTGTGNYTLAQPVITGDITAKELTVADAVVTPKVYDGNTDAAVTGATLTGVVGVDDVTLDNAIAGMFDNANVGADKPVTHTMSISGAGTGNYTFTPPVLTGDITAKELTVADAVVTPKVYDGNTDAAVTGATLTGVVGTDAVILGDTDTGTFDNANVGIDKHVTTAMTITGAAAGNYTLTQPVITGEITAKELTVTDAVVTTKVYDGMLDAEITGAMLTGVVGTDDVMLIGASLGQFDTQYVGAEKSVTTSMELSGTGKTNYTLTQPVLTGDITPKELTVANAVVTTKIYDGNSVAEITGAELQGVVGAMEKAPDADVVTLNAANTGQFDNASVGEGKPVSTSMILMGADIDNYYLTQPTLTGDITAKELTVADAVVTTKVYDGNTNAEITGAILVGVLGSVGKALNDDVILGDATTGIFADANVGNGIAVTTSMTISGVDAGNYSITQPTLTGDITARELTVANAVVTTKAYDGNTDAAITGATLAGVVGTDDVTLANGTAGQFADANIGAGKAVTHSMELSGAGIGNYTFTPPVLTGDITAKELTVADAVVTTKVYDGNAEAAITGATLTGVVGAEDVTLANAAAGMFDDANVGADKPVTNNMSITGADIDNYTFTPPVLTGDITAKELTIANAVVATKVYDGTTDAEISGAMLVGLVIPVKALSGDDVILGDATTGIFADANVGNGIAVTTAMIISGVDAGNYSLTQPTLTGDITAKELTVADAVVTTKAYDGNTDAAITGATLAGVVGTDDVTLSNGTTGQFTDANIGAGKAVTHSMELSGAGIGNYTFTPPVLTGEITAKELTVTDAVVASKVYDGSASAVITGATLEGVVGTEDVTLADADAGTFGDANVGTNKPVTTAMTISGAGIGNYSLTLPVLAGEITARELTVMGTFKVADKNYDGNTDATITENNLVLNGLLSKEGIALEPVAAFSSAEIGENVVVNLTIASALSGTGAGNYSLSLTDAPTTTANIIDPTINVAQLSEFRFVMYPNPVSDVVTIETGISKTLKIRLVSITGQEVFAGEISRKMQIDTSSLHPGIYFITIIDGDQHSMHKLIRK